MSVSYGSFSALIVGRRYYAARASVGEAVELTRQRQNPHDDNAIAVHTLDGGQLGHLPRWLAAVLAPCMDAIGCTLSGIVAGTGNDFVTPATISIYAPAGAGSSLHCALGTYWSMWQLAEPADADSSCLQKPAAGRMLVVSTARGIGDWIGHVSLAGTPGQVSWSVYSRALPFESIAHSQVVLVCIADAAHLLARIGTACWASVAVDKTAIGDELLAATPELASMLGNRASTLLV
ncbi:hypothetical protein H4R19_002239 [Coemansia spiralis]|nr:hypothetical protein H4R19_002239 [Coemansia spiralis]